MSVKRIRLVNGRLATNKQKATETLKKLAMAPALMGIFVGGGLTQWVQHPNNVESVPLIRLEITAPARVVSFPTVPVAHAQEVEIKDKLTKWEEFVKAVEVVAPKHNFPKNVILAQCALESSRGTSAFAKERNNFCGIGAYDHNPRKAFRYETAEANVEDYMRILKKNFPEAWESRDNPEKVLKLLVNNPRGKKYATDPGYINKVKSMKEWGN